MFIFKYDLRGTLVSNCADLFNIRRTIPLQKKLQKNEGKIIFNRNIRYPGQDEIFNLNLNFHAMETRNLGAAVIT